MMPQILPSLAEFSLFGIYIQPAVPLLLVAIAIADVLRRVLRRLGVAGYVWNWPLFMFAIYAGISAVLILALPGI